MVRKSLQYELLEKINLEQYRNNNTVTAYKKDIKAFSTWAKDNGYKSIKAIGDGTEALQAYSYYLQKKEYTPATIHRKLSSPCVALGVNMKEINKPKRTSDKIVRGRRMDANKQGKEEERQDKYKRLVSFQRVTGIRRAELRRLKGSNLVRDSHGYLNVIVQRGKGGKMQWQRILPEHEKIVLDVFSHVKKDEKVFSDQEMKNHINLHGIRAEVAQSAYIYYSEKLKNEPGYREKLLEELKDRYMFLHLDPDKSIKHFMKECSNPEPYILRGSNKKKAMIQGKKIEYNRLALMAVSVFHLSHWRLDVTVTNYLIQ